MNKVIELLRVVASGKTGLLIGPGFPNTTFHVGQNVTEDGWLHIRDSRSGHLSALRSVSPDIAVVVGPLTSDITEWVQEKQKTVENPLFYWVDE